MTSIRGIRPDGSKPPPRRVTFQGGPRLISKTDVVLGRHQDERLRRIAKAAESRPAVPTSTAAVAAAGEAEVGIFGFLGNVLETAVAVGEGITGIDVPFIGPGDTFLSGGGSGTPGGVTLPPAVPGGSGPLDVQGLAGGCIPPFRRDPLTGKCRIFAGTVSGPDPVAGSGMGAPAVVQTQRRVCNKGSVLDVNGFCRDKRTIRNSDRMYPKPRRPLLTGGDLNCIAKASRAASRMKTQTKRLQKLGMLPKARRGRS